MLNNISEISNNNQTGVHINLDKTIIGFIARGVTANNSNANFKDQHADCIIPHTGLIGFTHGGPGSSGDAVFLDFNREGGVSITSELEFIAKNSHIRAQKEQALKMIDAEYAKKNNYSSGVILIQAPVPNHNSFIEGWMELHRAPKPFNIIGGNCTTRAKEIFVAAGILQNKYFFIDTPCKLFEYLHESLSLTPGYTIKCFFGYVGFEKKSNEFGYNLIILN